MVFCICGYLHLSRALHCKALDVPRKLLNIQGRVKSLKSTAGGWARPECIPQGAFQGAGSRCQMPAMLPGGSFLNEHTLLCFMNEGKREWSSLLSPGRGEISPSLYLACLSEWPQWAWQRFWECCCSGKCIVEKEIKQIERERLGCWEFGLPGWGRKGLVYPAWRQLQSQWWNRTALDTGGEILLLLLAHISSSCFQFIYSLHFFYFIYFISFIMYMMYSFVIFSSFINTQGERCFPCSEHPLWAVRHRHLKQHKPFLTSTMNFSFWFSSSSQPLSHLENVPLVLRLWSGLIGAAITALRFGKWCSGWRCPAGQGREGNGIKGRIKEVL